MSFKVKKIRPHKGKWGWLKDAKAYMATRQFRFIAVALPLALLCLWGANALKQGWLNEGPVRVIPKFTVLDEDNGHTNILFLGVAGKNEQGGNLSDSIMLASINGDKGTVSLLSLPRDLYVDSQEGSRKVNEIYASARFHDGDEAGLTVIKDALSRFTGIPIHYAAVVDFAVFEEVVDELGGISLFVPEDIVDPYYPDDNWGYQTFIMRTGIQTMDGPTALQYARSRKTSSDYSRAKRQQDLLFAIKEKAKEDGVLLNPTLLKSLFTSLKENVNTDLGLPQILELGKVASGVDYDGLVSAVLNDDPTQRGGMLYAPAREFYNGQFVLLPLNLKDTQKFIELTLINPEVLLENAQIAVLNGSRINGLAGELSSRLRRLGFHVIEVSNYDSDSPVLNSFYEVVSSNPTPLTQSFLENYMEIGPIQPEAMALEPQIAAPPEAGDVIDINIVLGASYDD